MDYTLAEELISQGFSPDAVIKRTGLPRVTTEFLFRQYPDRAKQWNVNPAPLQPQGS